jgi:alpha/beta superfamily hydrolase
MVESFAEPKTLIIIASAEHFFEGRLREMRHAIEAWVRQTIAGAGAAATP